MRIGVQRCLACPLQNLAEGRIARKIRAQDQRIGKDSNEKAAFQEVLLGASRAARGQNRRTGSATRARATRFHAEMRHTAWPSPSKALQWTSRLRRCDGS